MSTFRVSSSRFSVLLASVAALFATSTALAQTTPGQAPPPADVTGQATPPAAATTPEVAAAPIFARGLVLVPRIGLVVAGSGDVKKSADTTGNPPPGATEASGSTSFDEKTGAVVGGDVLYSLGNVRLGGGLLFRPSTSVDVSGTSMSTGSDLAVFGIAEPLLPVSPTAAIALRGQLGLVTTFAGGDVSDQIDKKKADCDKDVAAGDPSCEVSSGPHLGWTVGAGGGVVAAVGTVRLRADLLLAYYSADSWSYTHTHKAVAPYGEYTHDVTYGASGTRVMLTVGVEIF